MVDLILFTFVLAVFLLGVWVGGLFGGIKSSLKRIYTWAGSLFA